MLKEKFIKKNNIKEISLISASYLNDYKYGLAYQSICKHSYVMLSISKDFNDYKIYYPLVKKWNIRKEKNVVKDNNAFYKLSFYSCKLSFDLKEYPNTTFYYKIISKNYESDVKSFTTLDNSKDFYFYSLVDFQHGFNDVTHKLIKGLKEIKKAPLMLNSGDLSGTSADYREWAWLFDDNESFSDVLFSSSIGDHEYWASYNKHASLFKEPICFLNCLNTVNNGPLKEENKTYYFLYNNVLFVFFNTQDSDTVENENIDNQLKWFEKIVEKEEGKYDYLIVYMHKSIYGSFENDTRVRKIMKNAFYPLFDKYKVDIVFSGHDHRYSRTYKIKNEKIDEDGTMYIDLGSSGNKKRSFEEEVLNDKLHEAVLKIKEEGFSCGAIVHVKEDEIIVNIYDENKVLRDSAIINKKQR